jgi:nucleolar GTP-binding protein
VGCPNVGKSSIVRAVSSGTPEVNNYPFTTRGMTLGHVEVFWDSNGNAKDYVITPGGDSIKLKSSISYDDDNTFVKGGYAFSQLCQVMDSPGLLARDDAERNEMEQLTLAAMKHLPTAVMYVLDFSGQAGDKCSSVEDQLLLRKEIRSRFPRRPWIDVVSKVDLGIVDGAMEKLEAILAEEKESRQSTVTGSDKDDRIKYIKLSIQQGTGLSELRNAVMNMLGDVKIVVDAMSGLNQQQKQ